MVTRGTLPMTTLASEPMPMLKHRHHLRGSCKCPCTAGTELSGPRPPMLPGNSPDWHSLPCMASAHGPRWPSGDGLPRPSAGDEKIDSPPCFTHSRVHGKGPLGTHTFPTRTWEMRPVPPNEGVTWQGVQGGMEIPVTRRTC